MTSSISQHGARGPDTRTRRTGGNLGERAFVVACLAAVVLPLLLLALLILLRSRRDGRWV